jgi:hypothetical protein
MRRFCSLTLTTVCILAINAFGQEDSAKVTLRITSNPPGVTVNLEGPYQLTTTTPADVTQELIGSYKVKAEKFGYERWSSYITLTPNQPASLKITLTPKTRVKAALRSVILPGWGQFYSDRKGWGYFFTLGSVVMATGFVAADTYYGNKYDDFVDVRNQFNSATSIEEKTDLKQKMDDRQRKAYDAQTLRNAVLGVGVAFWAYNVIDNIFFFPSLQSGVFERLQSSYDPNSGEVKLTYSHQLGF